MVHVGMCVMVNRGSDLITLSDSYNPVTETLIHHTDNTVMASPLSLRQGEMGRSSMHTTRHSELKLMKMCKLMFP